MQSEALGLDADAEKAPDIREAFSCGPSHAPTATPAHLEDVVTESLTARAVTIEVL